MILLLELELTYPEFEFNTSDALALSALLFIGRNGLTEGFSWKCIGLFIIDLEFRQLLKLPHQSYQIHSQSTISP